MCGTSQNTQFLKFRQKKKEESSMLFSFRYFMCGTSQNTQFLKFRQKKKKEESSMLSFIVNDISQCYF